MALHGDILQCNLFHGADKNSNIFYHYLTENTVFSIIKSSQFTSRQEIIAICS